MKYKILFESIKKYVLKYYKPIIFIFFVYLFGIITIIRANYNYIDDMSRVHLGYSNLEYGRVLSHFLSKIIHFGRFLGDISPLSQIIACLILSISSIILLKIILNKDNINIFNLLSTIPLALNPFYLENLSYKYDSPYMALSILFSVVPFCFMNLSYIKYILISIICNYSMTLTYQASSGIYPMVVILLSLNMFLNNKDKIYIIKFILYSALSYIIALLLYKLTFMPNQYSISLIEYINNIIPTFKNYLLSIYSDLNIKCIVLIIVALLLFIISKILIINEFNITKLVILFFSLFLMLFLSFGMYNFVGVQSFLPRYIYGFFIFIDLLLISISANNIFCKLTICLLAYSFLTFSFIYGNCLSIQKEWVSFRIEKLIYDLDNINEFKDDIKDYVQLDGSIGISPVIQKYPYKILNKLIPITFKSDWYWGMYQFKNYYDLDINMINSWETNYSDNNLLTKEKKLKYSSKYHDIYIIDDNKFLIKLK